MAWAGIFDNRMDDPREQPPVLSYEPAPSTQGRRRRLVAGIAAAVVVLAIAVGLMFSATLHRQTIVPVATMGPSYVLLGSGGIVVSTGGAGGIGSAIGIPYGRFFLIRDGKTIVAIRIQAGHAEPIAYEWQCSEDGKLQFGLPSVTHGTGSASEAAHSTWIVGGPIRLEWSRGSPQQGWLYWPQDRPGLQICSEMVDDPAKAGHDPTAKWYSQRGPFP